MDMLSKEKITELDKVMAVYSRKEIALAGNVLRFLEKFKIDIDTFRAYEVEHKKRGQPEEMGVLRGIALLRQQWMREHGPKCAECGSFLTIGTVNTGPGDQIKDKTIHSVWSCMNKVDCGYERFSKKTADVHIKKIEGQFAEYVDSLSDHQIMEAEIDEDIKEEFGPMVEKIYPFEFESKIDNRIKLPPCPDCKTDSLGIFSVNTGPSNMVGKKFKTQIYCNNCGWDRFSKKFPGDLMKLIRRRGI